MLITSDALGEGGSSSISPKPRCLVWCVQLIRSILGRFCLIDTDGSDASRGAFYGALASDEPELVLREGSLYAPRLGRVRARDCAPAPVGGDGTVLITGATGGLGALVACHLVKEHGVPHLLLVSRRGEEADGAAELRGELQSLGCEDTQILACDVSDKAALEKLIASIPAEHPLTAVIHAAGVLEDGVIESLDEESLSRVMAPKVNAAINLHELTEYLQLSEFVLFSSAAATLGSPGQGNYAAANAFLDALAHHRRAKGLPGLALAWGAWEKTTGMTGPLAEADHMRVARMGMGSLSDQRGLELMDTARANRPGPAGPGAPGHDSSARAGQDRAAAHDPALVGRVPTAAPATAPDRWHGTWRAHPSQSGTRSS